MSGGYPDANPGEYSRERPRQSQKYSTGKLRINQVLTWTKVKLPEINERK